MEMPFSDIILGLKRHQDAYGLVQPRPTAQSGNGLVYSAEMVLGLQKCGIKVTQQNCRELWRGVQSCWSNDLGLLFRHPVHFRNDQERQDDFIALGILGGIFDVLWLQNIVKKCQQGHKVWGINVPWYLPNEEQYKTKPHIRAWLGLYPAMIHHLKGCAQLPQKGWQQSYWCVSLTTTGMFDDRHDAWILAYLMAHAPRVYTWEEQNAIATFSTRFAARWPGGMSELLLAYFNQSDNRHPLIDLWQVE